MSGLLKEEILTTVRKKRFIILMPLLYIGAVVAAVMLKGRHFNDLTYIFGMQKYVSMVFSPLAGAILLFTVHRRKYTFNSIVQVEEHGAKRSAAVLARALAGCIILACLFAVMLLFVTAMSFVAGAHNTPAQLAQFALLVFTDCLAAAATYTGVLFWQYLFAFPLVPIVVYCAAMFVAPLVFIVADHYANPYYKYCSFAFPKLIADVIYTRLVLHDTPVFEFLILLAQAVIPLLLTMLVFKLKKKERKKKKKGDLEQALDEVNAAASALEAQLAGDPEIREIMKEAELTEELMNAAGAAGDAMKDAGTAGEAMNTAGLTGTKGEVTE